MPVKMRQNIVLLLTLITVMFTFFGKVLLHVNYYVNQDFYATVLCVKKDVPQNTCQGKCHLKKELKELDNSANNTEKNTKTTNTKLSNNWIVQEISAWQILRFTQSKEIKTLGNYHVLTAHITELLDPPKIS